MENIGVSFSFRRDEILIGGEAISDKKFVEKSDLFREGQPRKMWSKIPTENTICMYVGNV